MKRQSVVPRYDGGWGLLENGRILPSGKFTTQQKALSKARTICRESGAALYIHRKDGSVREIHHYKVK